MATIATITLLWKLDTATGGALRLPLAALLLAFAVYRYTRPAPDTSLKGRRLLITGAAHGIGAQLALTAAARGARLVLWDCDGAALAAVAERAREALRASGEAVSSRDRSAVLTAQVDVGDAAAMAAAQAEALRVGAVDSVVSCAGLLHGADVRALSAEQVARALAVNVGAPFTLARLFLPHMEAGIRGGGAAGGVRGTLVLFSSVMGGLGAAQLADYCASKHALQGLADCLRQELNRDGLRDALGVHLVCPWLVDTDMFKGAFMRRSWLAGAFLRAFPPRRAQDVAAATLDALALQHGVHRTYYLPLPMRFITLALRALSAPSLRAFDWLTALAGGREGMVGWQGAEHNVAAVKAGPQRRRA